MFMQYFLQCSKTCCNTKSEYLFFYLFIFLNFIFKLYNIVLVLPNIEMNPPQVNKIFSVNLKLIKTEIHFLVILASSLPFLIVINSFIQHIYIYL